MILRASRYRIIEVIPAVLALAFGWARAALALDAPDFQPPRIEIVAPVPDSIVRESRPQIVLILRDEESGLDPASFRLVLDRADLSREIEVAVAPDGTATVSLTPAAPLRPGPHQVWFQAQDKAGNPAWAAWNFTVEEAGPPLGFRLSGRSVTELTLQPLQHLTESLHLAVELKLGAGVLGPLVIEGAVQLDAATDYVGFGQPFSRFAPEIGDYTIGVRGSRAEALFGSVLVEFPALMLFPQTTSDGMLLLWDGKGPSGGPAFNLSGFGGRAVSSYGFSLTSFQYGGLAARAAWEEGRRLLLVAAETEESDCARLYLLGGETPLGGGWRLHVEGAGSRAEDSASDGYALYAGLRGGTATAWLNLSLWRAGA
ncbi:MAG: hypothetical protein K6U03_10000, partial [Firmicutes bacterium]|nr:hypothetical protein [Bacillota bacterium]